MVMQEVFERLRIYFGSQNAMARRLCIRQQSVNEWFINQRIPINRIYTVYDVIGGFISVFDLSGGRLR